MNILFIPTFFLINSILFDIEYVKAQQTLPTGCLDAFRAASLSAHNQYRSLCGVSPLSESSLIDASAQNYSTKMATTNLFQHSGNSLYGENLYEQLTSQALTVSLCSQIGNQSVASWYSEIANYNFSNPGFASNTGHYTQVVWKSSTMLGMGLGWSIQNGYNYYYVVGQYSPPGNYLGEFGSNVLPPLSTLTTTTTTSSTTNAPSSPTTISVRQDFVFV